MPRIISLFAPVLSVLFAALIVVIQAQPYDGNRLRALLAARGSCPMPCFLGIRAGMTPGDEALSILQNHTWVDRKSIFVITDEARQYTRLTWHWSGQQPDFLVGSAYLNYSLADNTVKLILVRTRIPIGEVLLTLGMPLDGALNRFQHIVGYPESNFFVLSRSDCGDFWQRSSNIQFVAPPNFSVISDKQYLLRSYSEVASVRLRLCR